MNILKYISHSHGKNASVSETITLLPGWYLLLTVVMGTTTHVQLHFGAQIIIVICYVSWAMDQEIQLTTTRILGGSVKRTNVVVHTITVRR